eukprot:m.103147 g.103147  ORF g.103147 m.103147 type:complete len:124 (-) comp9045_c0_seq3:24-395(-)
MDVVIYLFNDLILFASHVRVSGLLERARESFKRRAKGEDVLRPITDENGQEVLHKYKYRRMHELDEVSFSPIPDSNALINGLVASFPDGTKAYFQAPDSDDQAQCVLFLRHNALYAHAALLFC